MAADEINLMEPRKSLKEHLADYLFKNFDINVNEQDFIVRFDDLLEEQVLVTIQGNGVWSASKKAIRAYQLWCLL